MKEYEAMARVFGLLFSGAAVRLAGAVAALWVAHLGYTTLVGALDQVNNAMAVIK
jgi:hypothetical protein